MIIKRPAFLRNKAYLAVSLTHFFVDVLNSGRTLLVAILAENLGLSNAQVGTALILYNIGSALSQPFFGVFADRFGTRRFVVGGMGWMIAFYGLASIGSDWLALIALTVAGLGSGSFHPSGTKDAGESSQTAQTQATAIFFTAGQTGLFIGPILAGFALESLGRPGYIVLPALALSALVSGWLWVRDRSHAHLRTEPDKELAKSPSFLAGMDRSAIPLFLIIVSISTVSVTTSNFAPKLFLELGYSASYVGLIAGLYMMGSAIGGLVGGWLGDRFGRRLAIMTGLVGALLPLYYYIPAGDPWRLILLAIGGFFGGMPHSVLVISVQAMLPGRRAFASGMTLGLMFFSGAVGSTVAGIVADRIGLDRALQGLVAVLALALLSAVLLPARGMTRFSVRSGSGREPNSG